jgi:hypothetical protein
VSEYRNGYGQCKADAIIRVNELLVEVEDALHNPDPRFRALPEGEVKQKLLNRRETLRYMRMVLKTTLKCPR